MVLGYSYRHSPLIVDEEGSVSAGPAAPDYVPDAIPGSLAPHAWLPDGRSLYDLFGEGFTLLVLGAPADEVTKAEAEAAATGTPLTIVARDEAALHALYEAALALIRPDQHVAWRGDRWPEGEGLFARVTGRAAQPAERVPMPVS